MKSAAIKVRRNATSSSVRTSNEIDFLTDLVVMAKVPRYLPRFYKISIAIYKHYTILSNKYYSKMFVILIGYIVNVSMYR